MPVLRWFAEVFAAIGDIWVFRTPDVMLEGVTHALPVALGVAAVAGVATMVGHAVVFVINRVTGWRLVAGMALGALYMAVVRLLTAGAIAVLTWLVSRGSIDASAVAVAYLIAVAPHALAFLVFLPYFGLVIGRALEAWSLVCLIVLLAHLLGGGRWFSLAIGFGAWLASQALSRLIARPISGISSRIWTLITGRETILTAANILSGAPFIPIERRGRPA